MRLLKKNNSVVSETSKQISTDLKDCKDRCKFLTQAAQEILFASKRFVIEAEELNPREFKKNIEHLAEKFQSEKRLKKIGKLFKRRKAEILSFTEDQKKYLDEKEKELKGMIDLLSNAIAKIHMEGEAFNEKIYEQSKQLEKITQIDDLKKIKEAMSKEIENVRKTIKEKQTKDQKRIEILSEKCSRLDNELKRAANASLRDDLTGVYNIKAFDQYMKKVEKGHKKKDTRFSLIIIEIDKYDMILNTYGHQIANRSILAIAKKCQDFVSGNQFVARHKEGLFLVVLPDISLKDASKKAKGLCKAIAKSRYSVDDVHHEHVLAFTTSMGVSYYSGNGNVEDTTKRALGALYAAKRSGGNRVVSAKTGFLLFKRNNIKTIEPLEGLYSSSKT